MFSNLITLCSLMFAQGDLSISAVEDQKSAAANALSEINETQRSVQKQLEDALKDSDPQRIQCIRNAKQSIDQLQFIVVDANEKFLGNIATGDYERSGVDFRQIIVSQSAVRQLAAQAETCLGEKVSSEYTSQVQVDTSALSDIPSNTDVPSPYILDQESDSVPPPPDSSTFQN